MAYEVLARKWRPQQFDDVVGQDPVVQTLKNAIETKRLAHAYIFVGSRGVGKTSLARIFAKALNCRQGPTVKPCDQCDSCREITNGTSLDVLEIDGASNTGVDQVRDLRDTVKYAPARSPYKIYIIDEVHMLSTSAFNALLKTLEEPPQHVKFLFATTEPQKILATILSRCQRFDLRRISVAQLVERLRLIARTEKIKIDDDALLAIARGAEGGLRDAESALDQLVAFKGSDITEEDVLSIFGLVSRQFLETLAAGILQGNVPDLIAAVARLDEAGKDMARLVVELMEYFRNLLICQNAPDPRAILETTDAQISVLKTQAGLADTERLLRVSQLLSDAEARMRFALSRRTLLEVALIRCARAATVVSLEDILLKLQAGGAPAVISAVPAQPVAAVPSPSVSPPPALAADAHQLLALLKRKWPEVADRAGRMFMAVRTPLKDTMPLRVDGNKVVIGVDPEFQTSLEVLQQAPAHKAVMHAIAHFANVNMSVDFELTEAAAPAAGKEAAKAPVLLRPSDKEAQSLVNDPVVKKVLDQFNGQVVEIRK